MIRNDNPSSLAPDSSIEGTESNCQQAWGLQRLDIQACWQRGFSGAGIRVGHLDTGVDGTHPSLRSRLVEFVEFDSDGFSIPAAQPKDSGSHGTHTAGIICGTSCNNQQIGVAPNAELYSGMVIEGGKCLVRVLAGLDWMLDCKVRVLCISLGLPVYNPLFEIILSRMKKAGILVIAPAGNRGAGRTCSPANYPGVVAVGAINPNDKVARFSGSQLFTRTTDSLKPNLVAPGIDIPSAKPGGGLQIRSGTSMAAAHVAGVAALLFQAKANATAGEVEEALLTTCTPLPESGERRYGRGLINPVKALDAILTTRQRKAE
ncbi:MAG: S8 family serine peptidase [Anaerolineaceae bacterium]|nr:S8 family serine peptidase [Anaerolineaceae bacterium]